MESGVRGGVMGGGGGGERCLLRQCAWGDMYLRRT